MALANAEKQACFVLYVVYFLVYFRPRLDRPGHVLCRSPQPHRQEQGASETNESSWGRQ